MQVHLTLKSANAKTGPIPVSTTERASCPHDCNVRDACYAASGPLALHWNAVSAGQRGTDWATFTNTIGQLPAGQLWRHNQAGDLPVAGGTVDAVKLGQLVAATTTANTTTPAGRAVVICPATQRDDVSCATCQLCQRQRAAIVGFPAHGTRKRVIDIKLAVI